MDKAVIDAAVAEIKNQVAIIEAELAKAPAPAAV
jgi:hypothetical protein